MRSQTIQLQLEDGTPSRWITAGEAARLEATGKAKRISRRKDAIQRYRLHPVAKASTSSNSMPVITLSDMLKVAGVQRLGKNREDVDLERLIGFGLVAEGTPVPINGYLA